MTTLKKYYYDSYIHVITQYLNNNKETLLAFLWLHNTTLNNIVFTCKADTFWRSGREELQNFLYTRILSCSVDRVSNSKED